MDTLIRLLFDKADDGVFSRSDVVASAFAYFCHKLANEEFQLRERTALLDGYFLGLFPAGLYYHFVAHGFPSAPFSYRT